MVPSDSKLLPKQFLKKIYCVVLRGFPDPKVLGKEGWFQGITREKAELETPKKNPPQIPKYQKTPRLHELFRKVRANFRLLLCDASQEPNGNSSEKLVQMNIFILDGFLSGGFSSCEESLPSKGMFRIVSVF